MKSTIVKTTLSLAIVGLFVGGCNTPQSHTSDATPVQPQPIGYVAPSGATGSIDAQGGGNNVAAADMGANANDGTNSPDGMNGNAADTGAQGNAAPSWKYTFVDTGAAVQSSDDRKTRDIANYLNQNPTSQITVKGPGRPYVHSVVEKLTNAGVPRSKIQIGPSTDTMLDNGHEVDVNISN